MKLTDRSIFADSNIGDVTDEIRIVVIFVNDLDENLGPARSRRHSRVRRTDRQIEPSERLEVDAVGYDHFSSHGIQMNELLKRART